VADDESVLVVPLRSNAHTLVAGAPIAAMRRRLKFASLFYDRLFLETGILRVQAGPTGSSSFIVPPSGEDPPRWQTPAERHAATGVRFAIAITADNTPGATPQPVVSSDTTIAWTATLHPFADELPSETDWVDFVTTRDPQGQAKQLEQQWIWADRRNPALEQAIPVQFVRQTIIDGANHDLALATTAQVAATSDRLHAQVVAQRFNDEQGWKLQGFTVPLLFPRVGELPWTAIAELRHDRRMAWFRVKLREVEAEAMAEAAGGDIEGAARNAYMRHLADASDKLESVASAVGKTAVAIVIGGITGTATMPIPAPWAIVAGATVGAVPTAITSVRDLVRQPRSKGWVAVHQRIAQATG
jgi:hypothetical protein